MGEPHLEQEYRWKKLGAIPSSVAAAPADAAPVSDPAAVERGFEEGHRQGMAQARSEQQQTLDQLKSLVEQLNSLQQEILQQLPTALSETLGELFSGAFVYQLRSDPTVLRRVVDSVLTPLEYEQKPLVYLSEADFQALSNQSLDQQNSDPKAWSIECDPALPVGAISCSVDRQFFKVDVPAAMKAWLMEQEHAASLE